MRETIMAVMEELSGGDEKGIMMIEGRVLKPQDVIHDLLDVQEDSPGFPGQGLPGGGTGREKFYDLVDVVDKKPRMAFVDTGLHEEIMKRAAEIAEKVAREVIPAVAERVIREEIEKLKKIM
ncbi:MAG: hypothetical protein M1418_09465 [Deltaproteobacteria bacterium]|nr:hypothetical protein [Deltaproteobacteria bacterium]